MNHVLDACAVAAGVVGSRALPDRSTITLPRVKLECVRCRHTWKEAIPRWDRGHLLMKRGEKSVFVSDELRYELGDPVDFAPMLEVIGFSDFGPSPCPRCREGGARVVQGLLTPSSYGSDHLACTELRAEDFIKVGTQWSLRPEIIEALLSS